MCASTRSGSVLVVLNVSQSLPVDIAGWLSMRVLANDWQVVIGIVTLATPMYLLETLLEIRYLKMVVPLKSSAEHI